MGERRDRPSREAARSGSSALEPVAPSRWYVPNRLMPVVTVGWTAGWIVAFAQNHWEVGLAMLMLEAPVLAAVREPRRDRRARRRRERELGRSAQGRTDPRRLDPHPSHPHQRGPTDRDGRATPAASAPGPGGETAPPPRARTGPPAASTPPGTPASTAGPSAERSLAATLVRAETSGDRLEADVVDLVREVEALLRPLLAHVRARGADPLVRRDLELVATSHLPAVLDAYLAVPADYARDHRTASGTTPADELRSQLVLLVEGCRQLRDAVHGADLDRQQQLSRFLEAKFRRSDLDL